MAYHTTISRDRQSREALEIFFSENGESIILAMNSSSAIELLIECGGRPIRRITRPDNMRGRSVRAIDNGSTPSPRGCGVGDPN